MKNHDKSDCFELFTNWDKYIPQIEINCIPLIEINCIPLIEINTIQHIGINMIEVSEVKET